MSAEEVRRLGEDQTIEFKESLSLRREAMEALCGMVNTDDAHGIIFFGVAPDGDIKGIEEGNLDSAQQSLQQHIRARFDPPLSPNISVIECEGRVLISVKAERTTGVSYHEYGGRAWIREASTSRVLTFAEKQHLLSTRNRDNHNGPWRCSNCGSFVGVLSTWVVTDQGMTRTYECDRCGEGEFWPA
jgi:predicted HTH transcriptional regulator